MKDIVVILLGCTGVGKTSVSIELAKEFSGEIISADAFAVYRGMDIGTAKPSEAQINEIPHHLLNIVSMDEPYSAALHVEKSALCIDDILKRKKLPIVVGGTGLYAKALINGYNFGGTGGQNCYREKLEKFLAEQGLDFLVEKLKIVDMAAAMKIDVKNPRRVIRALEIAEFGSKKKAAGPRYNFKVFVLSTKREVIYERINSRVDAMLKSGLLKEIEGLLHSNIDGQCFQAIGYKEFLPYFKGEKTLDECTNLVKQHSRNYAKRQLTFFKGIEGAIWIDSFDLSEAKNTIAEMIREELKFTYK